MIPFKTQYDKIVGAYLRNELNPLQSCACFIGNLLNNNSNWSYGRSWIFSKEGDVDFSKPYVDKMFQDLADQCLTREANSMYTLEEIISLEKTFLTTLGIDRPEVEEAMKDEDKLFKAMTVTLEQLRDLHESKGEVIENYVFTKRQLV